MEKKGAYSNFTPTWAGKSLLAPKHTMCFTNMAPREYTGPVPLSSVRIVRSLIVLGPFLIRR
eukprot:10416009-Lingulodinium_polyedra.AAC.1